MKNAIDEALSYASQHDGYRAVLGIISTDEEPTKGILAWAALNETTGDSWVPNMSTYFDLHPQARWKMLTPKELRCYLSQHKETAFLYSQHKAS